MTDEAFKEVDLGAISVSAFTPITLADLEVIKNTPQRRSGGQSKKERLWGERTNTNWFQLPTRNGECEFCEHSHMVTESLEGKLICRRCYKESNDKRSVEERVTHEWPTPTN